MRRSKAILSQMHEYRPKGMFYFMSQLQTLSNGSGMPQCDGYASPDRSPKPDLNSCESITTINHYNNAPNMYYHNLKDTDIILFNNLSPCGLANEEERRCFNFFRSRTSVQMAGFFSSEIWDRLILQATHYEPAIRHAVLALGSLHERFENEDQSLQKQTWSRGEGGFALEHYNLAIQSLMNPANCGRLNIDVCLIACMLFCSFEVRYSLSYFSVAAFNEKSLQY